MKKLTRNDKGLMILSLIFFITILLFGVAPYLINKGSIWDNSNFLRGISIVIGIVLLLAFFVYFYLAAINSILFHGVTRYLRIFEMISLIFILQYLAPEETSFSLDTQLVILCILGFIIVTIDLALFLIHQKTNALDKMNELERASIAEWKTITGKQEGEFLLSLCFGILFFLFIYDAQGSQTSSYIELIAANSFLLYKYIKNTGQAKNKIKLLSLLTFLLSVISITLLEVFPSFFSRDELLYIAIFILPTIYLYPSIIRNFHHITWKSKLE